MLEDQKEERACLHVLGLLDAAESRDVEAEAASDVQLARAIDELNETLTNLSAATTPIQLPEPTLKSRVISAIDAIPPRVITDSNGHIQTINPAFTQLCGYRYAEVVGRKPGHFLQGPHTDPVAVQELRDAVRDGREHEVEMLNYHKNGTAYWVHIHIIPQRNEEGACIGYLAEERELPLPSHLTNVI